MEPTQRAVLVVEDDELVRDFVVNVLQPRHPVISAASGQEAYTAYVSDRAGDKCIGAVVSNVMMPDMNGAQLYHELKKIDAGVRFCFLSAAQFGSAEGLVARIVQEDGVPLLEKPVSLDVLRRTVDALLRNGDSYHNV